MACEDRWRASYEALKAYVLETGYFPNKHDKRLNWTKLQTKKITAATMDTKYQQLSKELTAMRNGRAYEGINTENPHP